MFIQTCISIDELEIYPTPVLTYRLSQSFQYLFQSETDSPREISQPPHIKKPPERAWDWDKNAQLFLNGITKSSFHTLTQSFQKRDFVAAVQRCVDKVHKCRQSDTMTFGNIAASAVISLYQHLCTYIKPPSNRNSAGTYLGGYSKNFPQRCGFIIGSGFPDARNSTT